MTIPQLLTGPWGHVRVGAFEEAATRDEVLARHLGNSGAQAVADVLDLPDRCMVYSPPETGFVIITDAESALGTFDPVLQFLFYKPLDAALQYYLCLYDWTMSAHILLADARRRIAVNAIYNIWESDRGTDWSDFRGAATSAAAIAAGEPNLRFGRVGFGGGRFREGAGSLERIGGVPENRLPVDHPEFFMSLGEQLFACYYLGLAPFIPDLLKVLQVTAQDGSSHVMVGRDDMRISGAFDWSDDLRDPMNPYRQGLIDLFCFIGLIPRDVHRDEVRLAFRHKVLESRAGASEMAALLREGQGENPSQSDNAAEKYLARLDQDPNKVFDALYPADLFRESGGSFLRRLAARFRR